MARLCQRDDQIHQAEQYLEDLMNELKDRKPFHEKLQQYKARGDT